MADLGFEFDARTVFPSNGFTLAALGASEIWVTWRNEIRDGKPTKVPLNPNNGQRARADDPRTWATRQQAEMAAPRLVNGNGGGIGIELAAIGYGLHLGGIDLDSCIDSETGNIQEWAREIINAFSTYWEISPSQTGVKGYFFYRIADRDALRTAMGTEHGKQWKRGGGEHPPAIELHISNRYFAVTDQQFSGTPETLEKVSADKLLWLIREAGPTFKASGGVKDDNAPSNAQDGGGDEDDILSRLNAAAASNALLRHVLGKLAVAGGYPSRSEGAFALGRAIKAAGWRYEDMAAALAAHPGTAEWTREKGEPDGMRELKRIWENANTATGTAPQQWGEPRRAILNRSSLPPPEIPLDVFAPVWADWITTAAQGANAPADYTAMPLLALASALLGNARWAVAWRGWTEPPILWIASVGNPSSGKSSGATPINREVMAMLERHISRDYPKQLEDWETVSSIATAVLKQWERDVAKAIRNKTPVPEKPREAMVPPKPIRPRAKVMDITVEKLATILASAPKGVFYVRDELAAFLLNLSRYSNGGTDKPFWLEAYNGGPDQVDRVKHPDPVFIPHLSVGMFGTIQPDRLEEILSSADDGMSSRYLWCWPNAKPFEQPQIAADIQAAGNRLLRLCDLQMMKNETGDLLPAYVHLSISARAVLADFARDIQTREGNASPLIKSSLGKARGQALRLSLVLEYLWWSTSPAGTAEPSEISLAAIQAATGLMYTYFLPMAARVLGDSNIPKEERNARTLAVWLMERKPERINVSMIRDEARLYNLRETDPVKKACQFLEDARWLREAPLTGGRGRPRGDYLVNPKLWENGP